MSLPSFLLVGDGSIGGGGRSQPIPMSTLRLSIGRHWRGAFPSSTGSFIGPTDPFSQATLNFRIQDTSPNADPAPNQEILYARIWLNMIQPYDGLSLDEPVSYVTFQIGNTTTRYLAVRLISLDITRLIRRPGDINGVVNYLQVDAIDHGPGSGKDSIIPVITDGYEMTITTPAVYYL